MLVTLLKLLLQFLWNLMFYNHWAIIYNKYFTSVQHLQRDFYLLQLKRVFTGGLQIILSALHYLNTKREEQNHQVRVRTKRKQRTKGHHMSSFLTSTISQTIAQFKFSVSCPRNSNVKQTTEFLVAAYVVPTSNGAEISNPMPHTTGSAGVQ